MIDNVIDLIFKGSCQQIDISVLRQLTLHASEVRISTPEDEDILFENDEQLIALVSKLDDIYLVIGNDHCILNSEPVRAVFIDATRNGDSFEILFFFSIKDFGSGTDMERMTQLNDWAQSFQQQYGFSYFVCQMDNGDKDEYYFDSNGRGPFYQYI